MAKKKVVTKKKVPAKITKKVVETPKEQQVMQLNENSTDDEIVAAHQHNIELLAKHQEFLIGSTMLDAKDNEIVAIVSKIMLIDRKLMLMGKTVSAILYKQGQEAKAAVTKTPPPSKKGAVEAEYSEI